MFESLPEHIAQIIEYKTWRSFQHKDFASYALDATSNGSGSTPTSASGSCGARWDVQGKHVKEWAGADEA